MRNLSKAMLIAAMVPFFPVSATKSYAQSQLQTIHKTVESGGDDVEEAPSGNVYINSTDLELVYDDFNTGNQTVGIRFTDLTIPNGATITRAYVQFTTDEINNKECSLLIEGQAADDAPAFSSTAYNASSRSRTGAKINWSPAGWDVLKEAGPSQATPDLKNVVQEIVNRPGWKSGNAMAFMFTGSGTRTAYSYERSASSAPKLVLEYSIEDQVEVVPAGDVNPEVIVEKNSIWKFHDKGEDLGTVWTAAGYDDAGWASGAGPLGYSNPHNTKLSFGSNSSSKHLTYYMRHAFQIDDAAAYDTLVFNILRDDGAVVYLNGVEQFRSNMPAGDISFNSAAASTVSYADETTYFSFKVPATQLKSGVNVLAVSVHQDQAGSSDLGFDMEVTGISAAAGEPQEQEQEQEPVATTDNPFPVEKNSIWKFHDKGEDLGTVWTAAGYDDAGWASGAGPLGYSNPHNTKLSFGSNSSSKHLTYYMRHAFQIDDAAAYDTLVFNILRDDGAVVYLNGVEQFRSNMPAGDISFNSAAASTVSHADETTYFSFKVPATQLKSGVNVLAVSVHQDQAGSSDLGFDMEVTGISAVAGEPKEQDPVIAQDCDPAASDKIGCFTSVKPGAQQEILVFPSETHTFQQLAKSGVSRYTSGATGSMPGGNDFTAYVAKNGSSKEGMLSVNHENSPGGISLLNLAFDEKSMLWQVNGIHKTDFSPVVKTDRNCSGGITPWGTVITSEETFATGDADGDGYQDVGWQVEIDPFTGKLRDYDGDGKPDKLWALGRMQHENIAVGSDGITVYQGEDGGTSCVYKFVADKAGDLSSGTLYVLKRSTANPSQGEWIRVPNSTKSDRNNTRNIAASLGGTDWRNVEDIEFGPDGKMYFTSKVTGTIWRFKDNGSSVSEIEAWVSNKDYTITHSTGTQTENFGTGIDNLVFDGEGNLWALQDGGRHHLWVIRPDHTSENPKVALFATVPIGAEGTGLTFSPDYRYGFLSIQHPSGSNSRTQTDAAGEVVRHNSPTTIVFARKEHLGSAAGNVQSRVLDNSGQEALTFTEKDLQVEVYPNPFRSSTQVKITMPEEAPVNVELLSAEGHKISTLLSRILPKGEHKLEVNVGRDLSQGTYILRISSNGKTISKRIIYFLKD